MGIKVKVEKAGSCRKILHVEAPADALTEEYEAVLQAYKARAKVSGFRPGKAPEGVVESRFGSAIGEDVKDRAVPRLYREALAQESIVPVAVVDVSDVDFDKARGVAFNVTVDVAPEFKLPRYKRIALRRNRVEVSEEQVAEAFERLLLACARYEDAPDRPAQADDMVMIDYRGECEGNPVKDLSPDCSGLGEGKDFWTVIGEPEVLPGFAAGLRGTSIGEEKDIEVRFPADYHVAAAAGKTATYHVTVKGVRQRVKPDINEEFLKRFEVDSEAALRQKVRDDLVAAAEREETGRLKNEIAKFLLGKTKFDLPDSVVEEETKITVQNMIRRSALDGATREQIERQQSNILEAATSSSRDRVRLAYVLSRIAAAENIEVEDQEVNVRVEALARSYRTTPEELRARLKKRNGIENLKNEMRAEKTLDYILEKARVKG